MGKWENEWRLCGWVNEWKKERSITWVRLPVKVEHFCRVWGGSIDLAILGSMVSGACGVGISLWCLPEFQGLGSPTTIRFTLRLDSETSFWEWLVSINRDDIGHPKNGRWIPLRHLRGVCFGHTGYILKIGVRRLWISWMMGLALWPGGNNLTLTGSSFAAGRQATVMLSVVADLHIARRCQGRFGVHQCDGWRCTMRSEESQNTSNHHRCAWVTWYDLESWSHKSWTKRWYDTMVAQCPCPQCLIVRCLKLRQRRLCLALKPHCLVNLNGAARDDFP